MFSVPNSQVGTVIRNSCLPFITVKRDIKTKKCVCQTRAGIMNSDLYEK